jgi:2-oxo-3-hexenedioate decarboxylase
VTTDPSAAAAAIDDAFTSKHFIPPFSDGDPSFDERAGYSVARVLHEQRVARGDTPVGRKIGWTNRTIWADFGVSTPMWAYMYDTSVQHAPAPTASFDVARLLQPRIEPEIQLHFARTPPVTDDEAAILECIDWIAHGFELVQCPYAGWRFTLADTIAAAGLHGALIVGVPVAVAGIDDYVRKLREFTITLRKDGEVEATGGGANVLDSPLLALAHLNEVLARQGATPVQAGEIVTTGTLTAAPSIATGETWSTVLDGIELPGISLTLE